MAADGVARRQLLAGVEAAPFGTYFATALIISIAHTARTCCSPSLAGTPWRATGSGPADGCSTIRRHVDDPTYTKIVPQFIIAKNMAVFGATTFWDRRVGWIDTWWALIFPARHPFASSCSGSSTVLPAGLEEAARMDGMGEFRSGPHRQPAGETGLPTVALADLPGVVQHFLWPFLLVTPGTTCARSRSAGRVPPAGGDTGGHQWNLLMAERHGHVAEIVLFLLTQRYFVRAGHRGDPMSGGRSVSNDLTVHVHW